MKAREPEPAAARGVPNPVHQSGRRALAAQFYTSTSKSSQLRSTAREGGPAQAEPAGVRSSTNAVSGVRLGPVTGRVPVQRRRPSATTQPAGKTTRIRLDMVPGLSTRTTFSQRFPSPANVSMSRAPRLSGLPGPHRGPPAQDQARRRCRPARPRPSHRCRTSGSST